MGNACARRWGYDVRDSHGDSHGGCLSHSVKEAVSIAINFPPHESLLIYVSSCNPPPVTIGTRSQQALQQSQLCNTVTSRPPRSLCTPVLLTVLVPTSFFPASSRTRIKRGTCRAATQAPAKTWPSTNCPRAPRRWQCYIETRGSPPPPALPCHLPKTIARSQSGTTLR